MTVRIKFRKFGVLKFIGHLDVMRYFQKAIRRAGIDVKYSMGFSPHQLMSFAAPLGVGLLSDGEYFDLEVNSLTSSEDMKKRLNECMVEGMEILSVKLLDEKAGNAMASVQAASYTVRFYEDKLPVFSLKDAVKRLMDKDKIPVVKTTKKSTVEMDLREGIYELSADDDKKEVTMLVNASSSGNIKPNFVIKELYHEMGEVLGDFDIIITRNETYTGTLNNFVPLDFEATLF